MDKPLEPETGAQRGQRTSHKVALGTSLRTKCPDTHLSTTLFCLIKTWGVFTDILNMLLFLNENTFLKILHQLISSSVA